MRCGASVLKNEDIQLPMAGSVLGVGIAGNGAEIDEGRRFITPLTLEKVQVDPHGLAIGVNLVLDGWRIGRRFFHFLIRTVLAPALHNKSIQPTIKTSHSECQMKSSPKVMDITRSDLTRLGQ